MWVRQVPIKISMLMNHNTLIQLMFLTLNFSLYFARSRCSNTPAADQGVGGVASSLLHTSGGGSSRVR